MPNPNPKIENLTNAGKGRPALGRTNILLNLSQETIDRLGELAKAIGCSRPEAADRFLRSAMGLSNDRADEIRQIVETFSSVKVNMKSLNEQPLILLPSLAKSIGLNESIVLQQIHQCLESNRHSNNQEYFLDGRWWIRNSYSGWNNCFPFWSEVTIKRTIINLENTGVLLSSNHNNESIDRTKWYTIDYARFNGICEKNHIPINSALTCPQSNLANTEAPNEY